MPHYELSKEQERFVSEAERQGLKVDYGYSNRFLKDAKCPAVFVSTLRDASFGGRDIQWDRKGDGYVIYAPY